MDNLESEYAPRNPRLCGFARVTARVGELNQISIKLDPYTYTVINEQGQRVEGGRRFTFYVGCSQPDPVSCRLLGTKPLKIDYMLE